MATAGTTSTLPTVWPRISMPRMRPATCSASSGVVASLMPPALPRPPVWTWALIATRPNSPAAARASVGVVATRPALTGTLYRPRISAAWYSWMFMRSLSPTSPSSSATPRRDAQSRRTSAREPDGRRLGARRPIIPHSGHAVAGGRADGDRGPGGRRPRCRRARPGGRRPLSHHRHGRPTRGAMPAGADGRRPPAPPGASPIGASGRDRQGVVEQRHGSCAASWG
jgi:hypothetical protein